MFNILSSLPSLSTPTWTSGLKYNSSTDTPTQIYNTTELLFVISQNSKNSKNLSGITRHLISAKNATPVDPYSINRTAPRAEHYFTGDLQSGYTVISVPVPKDPHEAFIRAVAGTQISPLMVAAAENNVSLLKSLLKSNPTIDMKDAKGRSPLMYAAEFNSLRALTVLLKRGASRSVVCKQDQTALMYAVKQGNILIVDKLLKNSIQDIPQMIPMVDLQDSQGFSALMMAADRSDPRILTRLLKSNPNPMLTNLNDQTAAMLAAQAGSVKSLKALINYAGEKSAALVNAHDNNDKNVMAYALPINNFEMNELLWSSGAKIPTTVYGEQHKNVLICALENASIEIVEKIVQRVNPRLKKVLLNHRDINGMNALMYAVKLDKQSVITKMLDSLPDLTVKRLLAIRDNQRHSIFHYLIKSETPLDTFKLLLNKCMYRTPAQAIFKKFLLPLLRNAIVHSNIEVAQFLLTYDDKSYFNRLLAANTSHGLTVLSIAAKKGQLESVNFLLEKGAYAYPNANYVNKTAAMFAEENGHKRVVERLAEFAAHAR
ncbi:ankyrin repeat domain-containing protein [Acerihabitans sp. TG2]|uniref:ankyrin repeat domain-containing protein n=1 Tax=Acerihabitans sp. TG2 TaxID=3096008 RepID=UPI002B228389|nr:ankyrin repeat domain-containing protein [Acerihabitans sp. TG2]MEA9391811.1 ankyrin repeat domain-containing protein [Acerihabitans sp. TG2]